MRKNVKRTIAVLSAVCMLPCPQVANVAVMAQNVSVGSSIGAKTLKQSLQTSTNFETASGKRREVKENNIEDSYDITYGDSITFFVSKTKIPDQDQTDNSGNEDDQKQDDGQKDSETDVIPDYEVPDTINGFSFNKEETDDGYQLTFTANEAMRSAAIKIKGQDVVLKTKKRKLTAKASVKNKVYDGTTNAEYESSPSIQNVLDSDENQFYFRYKNPTFEKKNVGEQQVSPISINLSSDNYEIDDISGLKATIEQKEITTSTIKIKSKVYDGTTTAEYANKVTLLGVISGDDVQLNVPTPSYDTKNVGTDKKIVFDGDFSIEGTDSANYRLKEISEVTGTIEKAKLVYRAKDQTRKYGEANPKLTYEVKGFVAGDQQSDFNDPTLTLDVPKLTSLGKHEGVIKISGVNLPEYYDVTYESGDLYVEANDIHENEHYKLTKPDGKNGWFTKKKFVIEPIQGETSGYDLVSTSKDGPWKKTLAYTEDTKKKNVSFYLKDSSNGAISKVGEESYKIDKTAPEVENIAIDFVKGYQSTKKSGPFKYFFDTIAKIGITSHDDTSGVARIDYHTVDEGTQSKEKTQDGSKATFEITPNFKGNIYARAIDEAGNVSEEYKSAGTILENNGKHSTTSSIHILQETQEKKYYNHDIYLGLQAEDTYSGIGNISYEAGAVNSKESSYDDMKYEYKKDHVRIDASQNNKNGVEAKFTMVDNTGHKSTVRKKFNIDVSKPEITISYDNNQSEGKYFKKNRTATITIKERNFDSNKTLVYLTKNGVKTRLKSNFVSDGVLHSREDGSQYYIYQMNVVFDQDGEYSLTAASTDLAGNKNLPVTYVGTHTDSFVIDKTKPVAKISFDNNSVKNEKYYKADRVATIRVTEKNFKELNVSTNGKKSGWSSHGNEHVMTVTFNEDKEYHLSIAGQDLAGNVLEKQSAKPFIVDKTKPKIDQVTPSDSSANTGAVTCGYTLTDKYLDKGSDQLVGEMKGRKFKVNEKQKVENGYKVTYQQIPNAMENDDYYTFVIQAEDKAGNISKKSIHFTVNRYGSVYHLSSYAKSINGTYVKDADKIVLEEINPDQLSDCNLKVVRDNDPIALKNEDASIEKKHDKWYKVTYTVNASALKEEGTYRIITSSKDTAKHTSSNDMSKKKASISFGVDTTKPNILISNIEGGKVYAQDGRTATVLVKDNLLLQSAKVYVNDNLIKEYDEKVPEKIDIPLDQKDEAQSIHVIVKDAAGNESEITMDNIYVTTNLWIRFIHSVPAMATAGGVSLAVILAAVIVLRKRIKAKPSVEDDEK